MSLKTASECPETEARIVELRQEHPGWSPVTIRDRLGRKGHYPGRALAATALDRARRAPVIARGCA